MHCRLPFPFAILASALALHLLSCQNVEEEATPGGSSAVVLHDASGGVHRLFVSSPETKATVVVFLMTDCPVANAMLPDLNEMALHFGPRGIRFYGIYAGEDPEAILKHVGDFRIQFPCLLDDSCKVARLCGATRVPEGAIFGPDGSPIYLGRIDDRAVKIGRMKPFPAERNLADALDALLAGRVLPRPHPATAGCHLPNP